MPFELREHTADVAVEAWADSLDEVVAAVADGMAAAMCDEIPDEGGDRFVLFVNAESKEALLFDYLDELIFRRDIDGVLPVDNETRVTQTPDARQTTSPERTANPERTTDSWRLEADARGVPLESVSAREIKAVTYSEMDLSETADGWHAYVVFDV